MTARVVHVKDRIEGSVYIGRANATYGLPRSPLANPFSVGKHRTQAEAVRAFDRMIWSTMLGVGNDHRKAEVVEALILCRDRPLACWCRHDGDDDQDERPCHGDIIVAILNVCSDDQLRDMASVKGPHSLDDKTS